MNKNMDIDVVLKKIEAKQEVKSYELLPLLKTQKVADRVSVNMRLAQAYFQAGDIPEAESLIKRAFVLSDFSAEVLPVYLKIFETTKNVEAIKFAYKRVALKLFNEGNIAEAIICFNKWQYAYASQLQIDKYDFDYDILQTIESYSRGLFAGHKVSDPAKGKIKIGYLLVHFLDPGSVLIKLDKLFAKYYDRDKFEVWYFVVESETAVQSSPHGQQLAKYFKDYGCKMLYMNYEGDSNVTLIKFAERIADCKIDILITSAALSGFENYFVASFRPAPLMLAVVHGPVAQYVTNIFDYAINSFDMHQTDTACNSEQISIELEIEKRPEGPASKKIDFGIPEEAVVLLCGGRLVKFQDVRYWQSLFKLIDKYPNAYLFVIGFSEDMFTFKELLTPAVLAKTTFFKWTANYQDMLDMADIYIDGYPMGGGVLMIEIMSRGIPVISFEHNYLKYFDGSEGSASSEVSGIRETYVERENFTDFEDKISSLIENKTMRLQIGADCKEKISKLRSDPARMVRRYEEVYSKLIVEKFKTQSSLKEGKEYRLELDLFRNLKFKTMVNYFIRSVRLRLVRKFGK